MARRGWMVFPEPGRQIVKQQARVGGPGLPWTDPVRFAELALSRAMHFFDSARPEGRAALFDRSVVDAVTALERLGAAEEWHAEAARVYRYAPRVFLAPPWEALFAADMERRHGFAEAVAEHERWRRASRRRDTRRWRCRASAWPSGRIGWRGSLRVDPGAGRAGQAAPKPARRWRLTALGGGGDGPIGLPPSASPRRSG
jgi:predicted ATPase